MRPYLALCLLLLTATALAQQGASVPLPRLSEADHWTYDEKIGESVSTMSVSVEENGGAEYRVTSRGAAVGVNEFRASDLARLRTTYSEPQVDLTLKEPCRQWRFPLSAGATYQTDCVYVDDSGETEVHADVAVTGPTSVTVPAGTFSAMLVTAEHELFVERWWFAAETCLWVKREQRSLEGEFYASEELRRFSCTPAGTTPATPSPSPPPTTPSAVPTASPTTPATTSSTAQTGTPPSSTQMPPANAPGANDAPTTARDGPPRVVVPGATMGALVALGAVAVALRRPKGPYQGP